MRGLWNNEDISNLQKSSRTSSSDDHINVGLNDNNYDIEEIHPPPCPMGREKAKTRSNGK